MGYDSTKMEERLSRSPGSKLASWVFYTWCGYFVWAMARYIWVVSWTLDVPVSGFESDLDSIAGKWLEALVGFLFTALVGALLGSIAWYTRLRPVRSRRYEQKLPRWRPFGNGTHMDLQHWQVQLENWLKNHHQHQDAAHDVCRFRRVWATAQKLVADGGVGMLVILTVCYFYDIASLVKGYPQRQRSSILAAEETRHLLREEFERFPAKKIEATCHAIAAHSFSAQIAPLTTEAKIVQDADRLETLGATGLARVFAVSGASGVVLFGSEDPFVQHRPFDDKRYALDRFQTKLPKLPQTIQTARGKRLAQYNAHFLVKFMAELNAELAGENEGVDHKVIDVSLSAG